MNSLFKEEFGKGICIYKVNETIGKIVAAAPIKEEDNLLILGKPNNICIASTDISLTSKIAQGNVLLKGSKIISAIIV